MYPCPRLVPLGTSSAFCSRCHTPLEPDADPSASDCWACYWWDNLDDVAVITYGTHRSARRIGSDIKYAKERAETQHISGLAGVLYNYLDANWATIEDAWQPTRLTYVPSHPDKVTARGFDFVEAIVDRYPKSRDALGIERLVDQVSADEQPLHGRFPDQRAWRLIEGVSVDADRIIVIDDMITSGATLAGVAQRLRRHGAEAVFGLVIARALKPSDEDRVMTELGRNVFDFEFSTVEAR
jgi:predicted amidophosphoribosyltransferase